MDNSQKDTNKKREKRKLRVRKALHCKEVKPRLSVFKSAEHFYAQLIDDVSGKTLCSSSTISKEFRNSEFNKKSKESAKKIGQKIAELAKAQNVVRVKFDRGQFKYHGVIAEFAQAAREAGLQF